MLSSFIIKQLKLNKALMELKNYKTLRIDRGITY